MGEANKRRALSEFSVDRVAQAYLTVMQEHFRPLRLGLDTLIRRAVRQN